VDGVPCVTTGATSGDRRPRGDRDPAQGALDSIRPLRDGEGDLDHPDSGGFAETGSAPSRRRSATLWRAARGGRGPVLVGGNCLASSRSTVQHFFVPYYKLPFTTPRVTARGDQPERGLLVSLTSNLDGIVFRSTSRSEQMDLTVRTFSSISSGRFRLDPRCYMRVPAARRRRFVGIARRLRQKGKRVLASRAKDAARGEGGPEPHRLSRRDYAVARALMEQAGVVVTETLDMFED